MSLYLSQISQLIALQKVDNAIFAVEERLSNAPRAIEALQQKFNAYNAQKEHIEEKLNHLSEQQKRMNYDFEDSVSDMKKAQDKLEFASTEKEVDAASRELENMEGRSKFQEDEKYALKSETEHQQASLEELMADWNEVKADLDKANEELETLKKQAEKELAELAIQRKESLAIIPVPVLTRYEFIRKRLKNPAIVYIKNGICAGCNIAIPPQVFNELQRGQQIVSCPNCQRLVFWSEHFEETKTKVEEETAE